MKLKHTREGPGRINFQDTVDTQKPITFSLTGGGTGKAGTSQLTSGSLIVPKKIKIKKNKEEEEGKKKGSSRMHGMSGRKEKGGCPEQSL